MDNYSEQQILETLEVIEATILNCEKIRPKLKDGSASMSLNKNRIEALNICKQLLIKKDVTYTSYELDKARKQISSIISKSTTGINNAKVGSSTYTRFSKLIRTMNIALEYLQEANKSL